jgi:hypothetical protein
MNRPLFGVAWISVLEHLLARGDKVETVLLHAQEGHLQGG